MMKKITALLLALLMCVFVVSCAQKDPNAPEDMKSATADGEPFVLYVPNSWNLNTVSGISGAYYTSTETIMVTARYYTPADPAMTLDGYVDFCADQYAATLTGFAITDRTPAVLGDKDAVKLSYIFAKDGKQLTCFQISALHNGDFVSLYGYCMTDLYETLSEDFNKIVGAFVLCDKADPNGTEVVDKNTPEGMEIASADHIEYRLYVPKAWVCNAESGVSEAYYPESGKSNVTVTSYSPSVSISVQDYFLQCENQYKAALLSYERIAESQRTVAERTAYSYTYRTVVEGTEFTVMQTLFAYNGSIYSFTYTALTENFDLHMTDVEAMLNAFTFR